MNDNPVQNQDMNQDPDPLAKEPESVTRADSEEITPAPTETPSSNVAPAPAVTPGSMIAPTETTTASRNRRSLPLFVKLIAMLLLAAAAGGAGYMARGSAVKAQQTQMASLHAQVTELQRSTYDLPFSAIKVSDCIPGMGSHYLAKDGDKEYGPFYVVNKQNKVIGIEFMATKDMYKNIPESPTPLEIIMKNSPAFGMKIDHVEFDHLPKGHEGLERDHIDVHMYTVSHDMVMNACN